MSLPTLFHINQFGSSFLDDALSIVVDDSNNIYVTGTTYGSLFLQKDENSADAFIAKYDSDYNLIWSRQIGTPEYDQSRDIAIDGNGNLYIVGSTRGLLGDTDFPGTDPWFAKFDAQGNQVWLRQLDDGAGLDIEADAMGNVYLSATRENGSILKYDTDGEFLWSSIFGIPFASATGSSVDTQGNVIAVSPYGQLAKYSPSGELLWATEIREDALEVNQLELDRGVGSVSIHDVTTDESGHIYLTGRVRGSLERWRSRSEDIWLAKYEPNGTPIWIQQFGSSELEFAHGIAVDHHGQIYVSGYTEGNFGAPNLRLGNTDAFLAQFDNDGELLDIDQWGTEFDDSAQFVRIGSAGELFTSGWTDGKLGTASFGDRDAWFGSFKPVSNQSTLPELSIENATALVGSGNSNLTFTVHLSAVSEQTVTVQYQTLDATATAELDYEPVSGTLTFIPGTRSQSFTIPVWDDDLQGDRFFSVILSNPQNAVLLDDRGLGILKNADFVNTAPLLDVDTNIRILENIELVSDLNAIDDRDEEGNGLIYSITGGTDQARLSIDPNAGVLSFITPPDFENPRDSDGDNTYEVAVTVADSESLSDTQIFYISITDDPDEPVDGVDNPKNDDSNNGSDNNDSEELKVAFGALPPAIEFRKGRKGQTIRGTRRADRLQGTARNDVLIGRRGKNRLNGWSGQDILRGGRDEDQLHGGAGNDRLIANAGADKLKGGTGNDLLVGGKGKDILTGGSGNDVLIGQAGADRLRGGKGIDVFRFQALTDAGDTIQDFDINQDILDLRGIYYKHRGNSTVERIDWFKQSIQISQVGAHVTVSVDSDGLSSGTSSTVLFTLRNIQAQAIQPHHFVL